MCLYPLYGFDVSPYLLSPQPPTYAPPPTLLGPRQPQQPPPPQEEVARPSVAPWRRPKAAPPEDADPEFDRLVTAVMAQRDVPMGVRK